MKTFKLVLAIVTLTGIFACSSTRKQTTEVAAAPASEPAPAPEQTSPPVQPSQTTYTVADLGASTAGRAK